MSNQSTLQHFETQIWQIGDCRFDHNLHLLERDGVQTRLPNRQSKLLLRLVQASGQAVDRQTLIDEVWQRKFVEDDVLSRAIAELRRALGDDSKQSRYIETIPKIGYRLCATANVIAKAIAPENAVNSADRINSNLSSAAKTSSPMTRSTVIAVSVCVILFGLYWAFFTNNNKPIEQSIHPAQVANARPLTSAKDWEYAAHFATDGSVIAYVEQSISINKEKAGSAIFLTDPRGQNRRQLTPAQAWHRWPALSPDGKLMVYLYFDSNHECELRLQILLDQTEKKIASCARNSDSAPAWSADQASLVYSAPASKGHATGLSYIDLRDGRSHTLTTPEESLGPDSDAHFIPGSNEISFARGRESERKILAVTFPSGKNLRVLVPGRNRIQGHSWTANAQQLIYASDAIGYRALLSLDMASKKISLLGARGARYPSISRNGDLVFDMAHYDANIWRLDLTDTSAKPTIVVNSTRYDANPVLSPDEKMLAFVSNRNDSDMVYVANTDGSNERVLSLPNTARWTRPNFSPDGKTLLLSTYQADSSNAIFRYILASGELTQFKHLGAGADAAKFSHDGKHLIYIRRDPNEKSSLWIADANPEATAAPRKIIGSDGLDHFHLSNHSVILQRNNSRGFQELDLFGNNPAQLHLPDLQLASEFAWIVKQRNLFAVVREQDQFNLWMFSLDSKTKKRLANNINASAVSDAIELNKDLSSLWFARTDSLSLDLMIVDAPSKVAKAN